jgi:hypothetical protein
MKHLIAHTGPIGAYALFTLCGRLISSWAHTTRKPHLACDACFLAWLDGDGR